MSNDYRQRIKEAKESVLAIRPNAILEEVTHCGKTRYFVSDNGQRIDHRYNNKLYAWINAKTTLNKKAPTC